jgi:hypothetical protein
MEVQAKIPVKTVPGIGGEVMKESSGLSGLKYISYILKTFVNTPTYTQPAQQ